ncbi:Nn.00g003890.m01.CDS01 [Neocucurbitaria sp. VM-36]
MSQQHAPDRARKYKEEPAPVASQKMHHPHSAQGLPPPNHLVHHPRPGVVQQHQHHPDSPHSSVPTQSPAPGHYPSPQHTNPQVPPQHQSPYIQQLPGPPPPQQQQQEVPYYSQHHQSPYSTNSAPSNYSSSETPELMAAATMNRAGYPPISYHTPQSNSPASVQSPQHDQHGRPIYGQPPSQMPQSMYYTPYASAPVPQQSPYPQHPSSAPQQPMAPQSLLMSQQQNQHMQHQHQHHPQTPGMTGSPKSRMSQTPLQRPPSGLGPPQAPPQGPPVGAPNMHTGPPGGPNVNPNAAPGPIPATTPLVVRQDQNGVQWIAFEYSRDRVKMEYTIRCDVESINVDELPQDFKTENCVYPRACCAKDQYKGNRLHYETECNTVGWALAQLNPCLRGKRGLIQRAVDSWRNSNQDPRLRSRRVRRMAKMTTRKAQAATHGNHMAGPGGPGAPGVPNSAGLAAPPRQPNMGMGGPQMHHHHDGPPHGGADDVSANDYGESHNTHHHQAPNGQSPSDVRQAQSFYPTYPSSDSVAGSNGMPPIHDGMNHPPPPPHAAGVPVSKQPEQDEEERKLAMFGDLPESKRRKFILVDDAQRGTRVRVRVTLDTVKMEEMPDSYRKSNSVFPRSYFAMQMTSPPASPRGSKVFSDEPDLESDPSFPCAGSTSVPVPTLDGEARVPKPRLTRAKRSKEITLNDLGYRMSWSQSRVFAGRTLFLQKSLDAYRNKMRSSMMGQGQDVAQVAPHFETRVGKRRWNERIERHKKTRRDGSP